MNDLGNVLLTICGFGTVCCGSVLLAVMLLMRVTGRALLLPIFSTVGSVFFGGSGSQHQDDPYLSRERRRASSGRELRTRAQTTAVDFDQALARYHGQPPVTGELGAQSGGPSESDTQLSTLNPPSMRGKSPYGVRKSSHRPGRRLRDGRFDRNSAPGRIPPDIHEGLTTPEGEIRSTGDDLLGPEAPPGLRGVTMPQRRRRRDSRKSEWHEDEIFGGLGEE
jgi:hypothetical protein